MIHSDEIACQLEQHSGARIFLQAMSEGKIQLAHFILVALRETAVNASVDIQGAFGCTLLMFAVELPRATERACFLQLLLSHGADLEQQDKAGRTALSLASEHGYLDTVSVLVEHGADPRTVDCEGRAPLDYAIHGNHTAVVKFLLKELKKQEDMMKVEEPLKKEIAKGHSSSHKGQTDATKRRHEQVTSSGSRTPVDKLTCQQRGNWTTQSDLRALSNDLPHTLCRDTVNDLFSTDYVICNPYALEKEQDKSIEVYVYRRYDSPSSTVLPSFLQFPLPNQVIQNQEFCDSIERYCQPGNKLKPNQMQVKSKVSSTGGFLPGWLKKEFLHQSDLCQSVKNAVTKPSSSFWRLVRPRMVLTSSDPSRESDLLVSAPKPEVMLMSLLEHKASHSSKAVKSHCTLTDTVLKNRCVSEERPQWKVSEVRSLRRYNGKCDCGKRLHPGRVALDTQASKMHALQRGEDSSPQRSTKTLQSHTRTGAGGNLLSLLRRHTYPDVKFFSRGESDSDLEILMPIEQN